MEIHTRPWLSWKVWTFLGLLIPVAMRAIPNEEAGRSVGSSNSTSASAAHTPAPSPSGNAAIRAPFAPSSIVITTTERLAGAIHSVTWNRKEFIDSFDHGRQLQSAANFDCGQKFIPEVFNPTEAGSLRDGAGPVSSSRLLRLRAHGREISTTTRMAFWLAPGEKSAGHPARNREVLSGHLLRKHVVIGYQHLANVIQYEVTFTVPEKEFHTYAQFEGLTGYMPAEFANFWRYRPSSGELEVLDDGPGEQSFPVVLATPDGQYAMGVYSPDQPSPGFAQAGYGRFRFTNEKVNKWNCVFRVQKRAGIAAGDFHFRHFVTLGTLDEVRTSLQALHAMRFVK